MARRGEVLDRREEDRREEDRRKYWIEGKDIPGQDKGSMELHVCRHSHKPETMVQGVYRWILLLYFPCLPEEGITAYNDYSLV